MGLLTDPNQRRKFTKIVTKYNNILCVACYIVGIFWFFALAHVDVNANTYFSENALLPGVVENNFQRTEDIQQYNDRLRQLLHLDKRIVPKGWLVGQFRDIGLDVYTQNFTIKYPLNLLPEGQVLHGQNVYAILRAPRAASTEAIVLTAPFRPASSPYPKTHTGIALMLSLAKYFREHAYWAKDLIFLVSDQEFVGMQAWLDSYHGVDTSRYIFADDLGGRSGSIQAAVSLEVGTMSVSHMNVNIHGLNGQLPNLDLVNLVTKLCRMEGIRPMLHRRTDHRNPQSWPGFKHSLVTMVTMMWHQATGSPSGNHGLFHQYNIEAVTLEGVKRKDMGRDVNEVGRIIEGVFRSLNNLMERFHQSFFFYLLPSTHRYVSIGLYMPPFALMVAAVLIKAVAMWIASSRYDTKHGDTDDPSTTADETSDRKDEQTSPAGGDARCEKDTTNDDNTDEDIEIIDQSAASQFLPVSIMAVMMGTILYLSPSWFASAAPAFKLGVDDSLAFGLLALFIASLSFASMLGKLSEDGTEIKWEVLKSASLIVLALVLFSCALVNISLAFFLAVAHIPPALLVHPTKRRLTRWAQMLALLLTSAPALLLYATVIHTLTTTKTAGLFGLLTSAFSSAKKSIFLAVLDGHLIGNWTYAMVTFAFIPSWLLFWALCRVVPM